MADEWNFVDVRCLASEEDEKEAFRHPLPNPSFYGDRAHDWQLSAIRSPSPWPERHDDGKRSVCITAGRLAVASTPDQPMQTACIGLYMDPEDALRLGQRLIELASEEIKDRTETLERLLKWSREEVEELRVV